MLPRRTRNLAAVLLGIALVGCKDDSSSCAGGNGKMCDIFSWPVRITQAQPQLHFTHWQVTEGACQAPRCESSDCTNLVFDGLFYQLEVTSLRSDVPPSDTRCRFQISSAEGSSLDFVLDFVSSTSASFCCNTGLRRFDDYTWSASVNGVEVKAAPVPAGYLIPPSRDGGIASLDAATP